MIECLNKTFGIENAVSVPTFISLIVFIVGGLTSYLLSRINEYNNRKKTRKAFCALLPEVISDLKIKERQTANFYLTIKPDHPGSWFLPYTNVNYLPTFFQLDFNEIYHSFQKKFFWHFFSRKLSNRSFHRIWAILRNLKFLEEKITNDLEKMIMRFDGFHKQYNEKLGEYRDYHDDFGNRMNGTQIPNTETELIKYLDDLNEIWKTWKDLDEKTRTGFYVTYNNLIKPILELNNNNPNILMVQGSTSILLECSHQYMEIVNILSVYERTFRNYFWNYRSAKRLLEKCLKIIK